MPTLHTIDLALTQMRILVVDDRQANVALLERLLRGDGYAHVESTTDPALVLELCERDRPDLLLLDLHMPHLDGFEVMARLQPLYAGEPLPILVLSGDVSLQARRRALSLGARDFLNKPIDRVEVLLRVRNLLETRSLQLRLERQNDLLSQRVAERTRELEHARVELLDRLALVAEFRDYATGEHTQRVGRSAALLAASLELPGDLIETIRDAAPLHDIGKIAVSDNILLKPGRLDAEETRIMRGHVPIGAKILGGSRSRVLQLAEQIALSHHECWDGTGYVAGLAGDDIPLAGRITAIADVFDALTHERPYKDAMPLERALAELGTQAGRQFDPQLVDAFMALEHVSLL